MDDNSADTTEKNSKRRFFLLLGLVLSQILGKLLFSISGSTTPTIYSAISTLWLSVLAWGCWKHLRKANFQAATGLGLAFALFLGVLWMGEAGLGRTSRFGLSHEHWLHDQLFPM
jgi:hypothetical protein